jgi:hypothetical protein
MTVALLDAWILRRRRWPTFVTFFVYDFYLREGPVKFDAPIQLRTVRQKKNAFSTRKFNSVAHLRKFSPTYVRTSVEIVSVISKSGNASSTVTRRQDVDEEPDICPDIKLKGR